MKFRENEEENRDNKNRMNKNRMQWQIPLSLISLIILIILINIIPTYSLNNETFVSGYINQTISGAPHGSLLADMLINWPIISIIFIIIMLAITTIAIMLSKSFNIPQLNAWALTEMNQLIVSAIIVVILLATLLFLDSVVDYIASEAFPDVSLGHSSPAHVQIANLYLNSTINSVKGAAKDLLEENVKLGELATKRRGRNYQTVPWVANSENKNAYKRLDMTRNMNILNHYGRVISSLKVQQIFINGIGLYIGPFFLLLGVILRSFFMTRRAGGLFISIGIGLLFILPLTYSLSLYTLKMSLTGYRTTPSPAQCPAECTFKYPLAYNSSNGDELDMSDLSAFIPTGHSYLDYINNDTFWADVNASYGIVNCDWACEGCAYACRELPSINGLCDCNETACASCPRKCKIQRTRASCNDPASEDYCPTSTCPNYCRVNYTMMIENSNQDCGDCPMKCRVRYYHSNGHGGWDLDTMPPALGPGENNCTNIPDCISCNAYATVLDPDESVCATACADCPDYCRIMDGNGATPTLSICQSNCSECPAECKAIVPAPDGIDCPWYGGGIPLECRFNDPSMRGPGCSGLDYTNIQPDCMAYELPTSICNGCFNCTEDCTNIPPIRTDCADVCGFPEGYMTSSPKDIINSMGDLGARDVMQDARNVGIAYVPGYILPILNIILTISFIRGMSRAIGGEIEIPGLSKLLQ